MDFDKPSPSTNSSYKCKLEEDDDEISSFRKELLGADVLPSP